VQHRIASVSIDLDEVDCYHAIHGLPHTQKHAHPIYAHAVPRLLDLLKELEIPGTFFAIGRDLAHQENQALVADVFAAGHEIANHSQHHLYGLSRCEKSAIKREIAQTSELIDRVVGEPPAGFRAPGYTITQPVFAVLEQLGFAYDSSVFPCPPYYAAKASVLALMRVQKERSQSILDDPRVMYCPTQPYRMGQPYWRKGTGMIEIPIGLTPWTRLPYMGTTFAIFGAQVSAWLTRMMARRSFVHLQLHGIDVSDAQLDDLTHLIKYQPELRRPLAQRLQTLRDQVRWLKQQGFQFLTLRQVSQQMFS